MLLAHTHLTAPDGPEPHSWMLFLHGILGRRANWRGFARRFLEVRRGWGAVVADLREHGESRGHRPPHSLAAAADDVVDLIEHLEGTSGRVEGLLGHSFGGKVVAHTLRTMATVNRGQLEEAWVIDAPLGVVRRQGTVAHVLDTLGGLPPRFADRSSFLAELDGAGIQDSVARWLAMNLERCDGGLRFPLDLGAIEALLSDFHRQDLWSVVEGGAASRVHLVVGARASALDAAERARAQRAADSGWIKLHTLPRAGHWVHVDDPEALVSCMAEASRQPATKMR